MCRREGIVANLYSRWSKEFLEAGKKRLLGDTQREASSSEVHDLRKENARLKERVAETVLENRLLKKKRDGFRFARGRGVRVSASEKLELIRLVEGSLLSIRRTLTEIGLPHSTFSAWYKRSLEGGPEALEDRKPRCRSVWNRIPERIRAPGDRRRPWCTPSSRRASWLAGSRTERGLTILPCRWTARGERRMFVVLG